MTILDSLVLGAVQGITEFIPVSSSGHLVLAEKFLGLDSNFTFGVLLNVGTLIALVLFFRKRILKALRQVFIEKNYKFGLNLTISIVPTIVVGFLLGDFFEGLNDQVWIVVLMLLLVGILMLYYGKQRQKVSIKTESEVGARDALAIGMSQTLALIPGVSRSGITILTSLNRNFSVEAAANFSFLMAAPTILGAIVHSLLFKDGLSFISQNSAVFWFGNLASLLLGLLAVKTMINLLKKYGLIVFGWYRIGLGAVIGLLLLTNVL